MRTLIIASTLVLLATSTHAQVTCQQYGNQQFCSNGLSSQTYGNQTYYNNGVTSQTYGNQTYFNAPVYTPPPVYQPVPIQPYANPYRR